MNLINITKIRQAFDTVILNLPKNTTFDSDGVRIFCYDIFNSEINKQKKELGLDIDAAHEELFSNYDFAEEIYYDYQTVLSTTTFKK